MIPAVLSFVGVHLAIIFDNMNFCMSGLALGAFGRRLALSASARPRLARREYGSDHGVWRGRLEHGLRSAPHRRTSEWRIAWFRTFTMILASRR